MPSIPKLTARSNNNSISQGWMRLSRRRLGAAAAGASAAAMLAACGNKKGSSNSTSSQSASTGKPKTGGVLNLQLIADFFDFDASGNGKTDPNGNATTLVYDQLLTVQEGSNVPYDNTTLIPSLAQKWETPDAQVFTFHMRSGVNFANTTPVNGRALTSADVKWSFEYASRTGAFTDFKAKKLTPGQFSYMFEGLNRIDTPDAATVVAHFDKPFAPFLSYVATRGTPIAPHEIYDQDGSLSKRLVGSGSMQLDVAASQHGASWVFKRNPTYWQSGKPYIDGITYLVFADTATMYAAFQTGQIDILKAVANHDVKTVAANNASAIRQQALDPGAEGIYMNAEHPPFSDARARQAVSLAINRDEFDKTLGSGEGNWVMPAATPDLWTQAETKQILKYDPQQAKQLLSAAGYPNGVDVEFMFAAGKDDLTTAQLLQAQLKAVGINLTIQQVDAATKSSREHQKNFTVDLHAFPIFGDLDSRLYGTYYSTGSANRQGTKDPQLDQLIEAERREPDPTKRRDALRAVTKYIAENAVDIALYRPAINTFWHPYVKNYADNWQQWDFNAANVWLEK